MEFIKHEEILYVIEVHGHAPEFWPAIAFRKKDKKGVEDNERQKEIKCPYCQKLFMVVNEKRRLYLVRLTAKKATTLATSEAWQHV